MQTDFDTIVLYSPICENTDIGGIFPQERKTEIQSLGSDKSRCEKYTVWQLLKYGAESFLNLKFDNLQFTKTDNGKWICPEFEFSLSHTDGLACAVLSHHPVGVDTEQIRPLSDRLSHRILTERERGEYEGLAEPEKGTYLLDRWVRKESIFKRSGGKALLPGRIETDMHYTVTKTVTAGGRKYLLSVCTDKTDKILYKYMEEI